MAPSSIGRLAAWILAWLLVLPGVAAAFELVPAGSFAADALVAREHRIPILVFYSRDDCKWCDITRSRYMIPLARDKKNAQRVLIRVVDLSSDFDTPLTDFSGRTTTHHTFARMRRIRMTPTLDFLDDRGNRLVDPIVGMRSEDFYGLTVERAIEASLAKMREK